MGTVVAPKVAIYAGTFDPITNGHLDIVERAAGLFDHVIIAVNENEAKGPKFSIDERLKITQQVINDHPDLKESNITVKEFDGLLVNFAKAQGAATLVRGIRTATDFEYEFQMTAMNVFLANDVETVFLRANTGYEHISSSFVRTLCAQNEKKVAECVPPAVYKVLTNKYKM